MIPIIISNFEALDGSTERVLISLFVGIYNLMYVCICNAVTDKQLLSAHSVGGKTIDETIDSLGVGSCCGRCLETAENLLMENSGVQHFNPASPASNIKNL